MVDDSRQNDKVDTRSVNPSTELRPPSQEVLELDHVYEALAQPRRRYLCYSLLEDTEWTLAELASEIAAWESDGPEVDDQRRNRVYVSLYHSHVPKLADQDVVSFDEETETVYPAENAEQVLVALTGMGATLEENLETHARREATEGR